MRRKTRKIKVGNLFIGGDAPVSIQGMTKTPTSNLNATLSQIRRLEKEGAELIRLAITGDEDIKALSKIIKRAKVPLCADIHFDYKLALKAIGEGIDKIRINPGNITSKKGLKEIALLVKERNIPIRIGVNSGSVKIKGNIIHSLLEAAKSSIHFFEDLGFFDIVISLKSPDVTLTFNAYQKLAKECNYPFHLGITEAGPGLSGIVKSSIGIGSLLLSGIGDTLRVSLTSPPEEEIRVGKEIIQALCLRHFHPEIISCPTCGRCQIDLFDLVKEIKRGLPAAVSANPSLINKKIAVMGCVVNGPGEAKMADIGIAGGKGSGILFKKGKIIKKVPEKDLARALLSSL